jgi:hypothetical protein
VKPLTEVLPPSKTRLKRLTPPKKIVWCYSSTMATPQTSSTAKKSTKATKAGGPFQPTATPERHPRKAVTKKETVTGQAASPAKAVAKARTTRRVALVGADRVVVDVERGPAWEPSRRAEFLVAILGNKLVAELLQVAESQPSQWRRAKEVPGPQVAPLLMDLDHVVGRLLLIWHPSVIGDWLRGSNAFLEGARPIDVLTLRGSTPVIQAIEAEAQGAYA